jgi:hypothetical protein
MNDVCHTIKFNYKCVEVEETIIDDGPHYRLMWRATNESVCYSASFMYSGNHHRAQEASRRRVCELFEKDHGMSGRDPSLKSLTVTTLPPKR